MLAVVADTPATVERWGDGGGVEVLMAREWRRGRGVVRGGGEPIFSVQLTYHPAQNTPTLTASKHEESRRGC